MKIFSNYLYILLTIYATSVFAQNSINDLAEEADYIWAASDSGLLKINKTTNSVFTFNPTNSGLPSKYVSIIKVDKAGNKWMVIRDEYEGDWLGLTKFDGDEWTNFNIHNSALPTNRISDIEIDDSLNVWISFNYSESADIGKFDGLDWTFYKSESAIVISSLAIDDSLHIWASIKSGGIAKFDGMTWTIYNTGNSNIPFNSISLIEIDTLGNKWLIASSFYGWAHPGWWEFKGIIKFNDSSWTLYDTTGIRSRTVDSNVQALSFDKFGNKWFSTSIDGLTKFDGTKWIKIDTSNSAIPSNLTKPTIIDSDNNLWVGFHFNNNIGYNGVSLAKYDGESWESISTITSLKENQKKQGVRNLELNQNYPNPFNPTTTISYQLKTKSNVHIAIYDISGKEIKTLVNQRQKAGQHSVDFDASGLSSGIYIYKLSTSSGFVQSRKMVILK
ncbi:MAG: T9SS C-terminal target domain-containing protein [Calditrichaeota bacterium]|nr:MAG: T9SS C-terminal target domain-containing protein [Calditrichota bacterium]MBL1207404.1 T9SS C-terminal target domain-containing protein [Calditrichota bacterium]NOG47236.1 T9SS type A sorting domain-containing protein [Calditrichota bacterium]